MQSVETSVSSGERSAAFTDQTFPLTGQDRFVYGHMEWLFGWRPLGLLTKILFDQKKDIVFNGLAVHR